MKSQASATAAGRVPSSIITTQAAWKNSGHSNWLDRFALRRGSNFAHGLLPSARRPRPQMTGARAMVSST